MQPGRNIAARAAHWSANHRKTAIWGWLAFVFVVVALIMGAQVVEQKDISTVDSFSGESQQAERALTDAGLRPNEEVVLIQNEQIVRDGRRVPGRRGRDRGRSCGPPST